MINPANPSTYILSPINHKENYELSNGVMLYIDKSFENNLRERNPQLGRVEAVPDNNPLGLAVGDTVAVNHFTFYGDIGKDRAFKIQDHFTIEGVMHFRAVPYQMFFKYNNEVAEPFSDYILCEYHIEAEEHFGVYFGDKKMINCTHGIYEGSEVLVLNNAMYLITLGRKEYYKVRVDEVVCVDGNAVGKYMMIEYLPEVVHGIFDLSMVKKPNNLSAMVIQSTHKDVHVGDKVRVYRNQGVGFDTYRLIEEDSIIFIYEEA